MGDLQHGAVASAFRKTRFKIKTSSNPQSSGLIIVLIRFHYCDYTEMNYSSKEVYFYMRCWRNLYKPHVSRGVQMLNTPAR